MIKSFKNILFATNLMPDCMAAFDLAAAVATRFQATLVLLHVIEKMPDYVESRLRTVMGDKRWEETIESQAANARENLIGKKSSNTVIKTALAQFCTDAGIDDAACGYHSREIVVTEGDVIDDILECSRQYQCDLIVMGAKGGLLSHNAIGPIAKGVMRQSTVPVMVVPPEDEKGAE